MTIAATIACLSGGAAAMYGVAGVAKLAAGFQPLETFLAVALLPRRVAAPAARTVPFVELALGVALIVWPGAWTAIAASAMATGFLAILLSARLRGVTEPCHCFGALDASTRATPVPLLRAVMLLGCCAAVTGVAAAAGRWSGSVSMPWAAIGALAGAAFVAIAALGAQVWSFRILLRT